MNLQAYKRRLLDVEADLSNRLTREQQNARTQVLDEPGDVADASTADEAESQAFSDAELDASVLQQVRDALQRLHNGTFGRCIVDGEPIDEKRLEAVPWTPYCLKHQQLLEGTSRPKPTL